MLTAVTAGTVQGAEVPWKETPYSHVSDNERLSDLLRDFFASQGINAVVSENITGTVNGRFDQYAPKRFFRQLAAAYALIWYYDGNLLYVYKADEADSRLIYLEFLRVPELTAVLKRLGIYDERFSVKGGGEDSIAYVSGPARYVALVVETSAMMDAKAAKDYSERRAEDVIRVFPLKYAWAEDQTFYFMDTEVTIPGMVTTLRNVLAGRSAPGAVTGRQERRIAPTVSKLKGKGLASLKTGPDAEPAEETSGDRGAPGPAPTAGGVPPEVSIQPDMRLNAVIIRDAKEKMTYYEEIISILDVPAGLVQIQATIMDVNTDYFQDLGIDWRFQTDASGSNASTRGGFMAGEGLDFQNPAIVDGAGFGFATLIGDAEDFVLARVKALEDEGKARILSRPSVLTLNNSQALLEHSQTFYVRVAGDQEVDLFNVTAGIVLKVTPHIIEEDEDFRVKLSVRIQDDDVLDTAVDEIPVIQNSSIRTQAVVGENESLLIGGYIHETATAAERRIPCLGGIPILGYLFKNLETGKNKSERLFMITPKIVRTRSAAVNPEIHPEESLNHYGGR